MLLQQNKCDNLYLFNLVYYYHVDLQPGLSLSFQAAVACKLSPVAVKYVAHGHVLKARKGLSI